MRRHSSSASVAAGSPADVAPGGSRLRLPGGERWSCLRGGGERPVPDRHDVLSAEGGPSADRSLSGRGYFPFPTSGLIQQVRSLLRGVRAVRRAPNPVADLEVGDRSGSPPGSWMLEESITVHIVIPLFRWFAPSAGARLRSPRTHPAGSGSTGAKEPGLWTSDPRETLENACRKSCRPADSVRDMNRFAARCAGSCGYLWDGDYRGGARVPHIFRHVRRI